MRVSLSIAVFAPGCTRASGIWEGDLAAPPDLGGMTSDLAASPDLTVSPDLSAVNDLAVVDDLSAPDGPALVNDLSTGDGAVALLCVTSSSSTPVAAFPSSQHGDGDLGQRQEQGALPPRALSRYCEGKMRMPTVAKSCDPEETRRVAASLICSHEGVAASGAVS